MYNRYIPQPDGSFRRNRIEDPHLHSKQEPICEPPSPPCKEEPTCPPPPPPKPSSCEKSEPLPGFLKQLLPKDFDTGDLIIILLLLLMAGDCQEDRATALLTLALYLIL